LDSSKQISWCLENHIKIYVEATRQGKNPPVVVVIDFKGKIKKGKTEYNQKDNLVWIRIKEIYRTYYDHYNKQLS